MITRVAAALIALITIAAATGYFFLSDQTNLSSANNPEVLALGARVYAEHCAACHGANGEGQPGWQTESTPSKPLAPAHDATGHSWEHPGRTLFRYIKTGVLDDVCTFPKNGGMPIYLNVLSDDEIRAVVAFMVSRWPEHIRAQHEAVSAEYDAQDDLLSGDN